MSRTSNFFRQLAELCSHLQFRPTPQRCAKGRNSVVGSLRWTGAVDRATHQSINQADLRPGHGTSRRSHANQCRGTHRSTNGART